MAKEWSQFEISWWSRAVHTLNGKHVTTRSWICSHKLGNCYKIMKQGCKLGKMRKWCVSSSFKLMELGKWSLFLPPHKIIPCCGYSQDWSQSRSYSFVAPSGKHCNWLVGTTISQVHSQQECDASEKRSLYHSMPGFMKWH